MKSLYFTSAFLVVAASFAIAPKSQACPYRLVPVYGYNITTGQPETRMEYRPDCSLLNQPTTAGEVVFPTGYGIPEISTPDGQPLNVHESPSFDSPVVGTIANGSALPLTGTIENRNWFETMDGYWVYGPHVE